LDRVVIAIPGSLVSNGARRRRHTDIRIVSSLAADGQPVPENCRQQAHVFAESLVRYPRPTFWHWVLVCDQAGWRRFLRLSGRGEEDPIYASTDLAGRTTYLRGTGLSNAGDFGVEMDEVVAHELAHIRLNSQDESKARALARRWTRTGDETRRGTANTGN